MTYGAGSIGKASISTLSKDFRAQLCKVGGPYHLDNVAYTIEDVAKKAKQFLFEECYKREYPEPNESYFMGYRVCGYSAAGVLPEAWEIRIIGANCEDPKPLYAPDDFGPRWAGETEAIDRLVLGVGTKLQEALVQLGANAAESAKVTKDLIDRLYVPLYLPAMPIQDAIDLAEFLASTAAKFTQFNLRAPTVGGPIEVATITKHEGFKWVSRKHYYDAEFNIGVTDHVA